MTDKAFKEGDIVAVSKWEAGIVDTIYGDDQVLITQVFETDGGYELHNSLFDTDGLEPANRALALDIHDAVDGLRASLPVISEASIPAS